MCQDSTILTLLSSCLALLVGPVNILANASNYTRKIQTLLPSYFALLGCPLKICIYTFTHTYVGERSVGDCYCVCLSVCVWVGGWVGVGVFEADTRKIGSKDMCPCDWTVLQSWSLGSSDQSSQLWLHMLAKHWIHTYSGPLAVSIHTPNEVSIRHVDLNHWMGGEAGQGGRKGGGREGGRKKILMRFCMWLMSLDSLAFFLRLSMYITSGTTVDFVLQNENGELVNATLTRRLRKQVCVLV